MTRRLDIDGGIALQAPPEKLMSVKISAVVVLRTVSGTFCLSSQASYSPCIETYQHAKISPGEKSAGSLYGKLASMDYHMVRDNLAVHLRLRCTWGRDGLSVS